MYEIKNVPCFIADLQIGKISTNLKKKKYVLSMCRNLGVGEISEQF